MASAFHFCLPHSDWWAEEDATEEWGRQKWNAEAMTYKGRQCKKDR
jgi:hypothetical protein